MATGLGNEVALGLLAGPAELARLRATRHQGLLARVWNRYEAAALSCLEKKDGSMICSDLALVAAVTQRGDLASAAINAALEIAHAPSWQHWEAGCIGLTGMHNAHYLTLTADWLWPLLNRDQREALLGALVAKSVENLSHTAPGIRDESDGNGQLLFVRRQDKDDPYCLHPKAGQVNNWDIWFSSGLFLAAALVERAFLKPDPAWPALRWGNYYQVGFDLDQTRVDRWKAIAIERITTALATQLGPDGDYAEGVSYTEYSGMAIIHALTALERVDGLNLWAPALLALPHWQRNQFVADLPFGAANFNDARLHTGKAVPLLLTLASRAKDPELQGIALEALEVTQPTQTDYFFGYLALLGLDPDLPATPPALQPATLFAHSGQVIWRTAQDRSGVFFSLKSGAYGGAHQHRDRNTFFLSAYGEHLIVDSGDGRYANPPTDPNFAGTRAHNCVLINGKEQVGDNDNPTVGAILEHAHDGELSTLLADAAGCYPGNAACRRRVVFTRPDLLVIADRVDGECGTLTWLLQGNNSDGKASWACSDRAATLTRPLARLHVFFLDAAAQIVIGPGSLDGAHQAVLSLAADVPGRQVTAVLVPARADEPAPACIRAADGSLTLNFRGNTHTVSAAADAVTVNGKVYTA